jgi:hypothetical protein
MRSDSDSHEDKLMTALVAFDERIDCLSIIFHVSVGDYLALIEKAYANRGGIRNQRSPLKTTSARRIRQRMKDDISNGAIIPPVVIGLVVESEKFEEILNDRAHPELEQKIVNGVSHDQISIIDGMQRTTALIEAVDERPELREKEIRVELWVSKNESALIYRMLVLNAGQIPWDLKKQISVIFEPLINEAHKNTNASRIIEYGTGRRFNPGEYSSSDIAELYIAFSSRKLSVDSQEVLTDEFTKLDIVESLSKYSNREYFFRALDVLIAMDNSFSSYGEEDDLRKKAGRQIFDKQGARVGLIVAISISTVGRAGFDAEPDEVGRKLFVIERDCERFCDLFSRMTNDEKREFVKLDILSELLGKRVGQVGRYERNLFFEGFRVLIEKHFDVPDMEGCWRAQL